MDSYAHSIGRIEGILGIDGDDCGKSAVDAVTTMKRRIELLEQVVEAAKMYHGRGCYDGDLRYAVEQLDRFDREQERNGRRDY